MKRIAVAVAVLVAALGLVACGGGSDESPKQRHLDELAEKAPELQQSAEGSLALLALTEGDASGAREDLANACPDTAPDEAMEHLREIQESNGSREDIEAELSEDLC